LLRAPNTELFSSQETVSHGKQVLVIHSFLCRFWYKFSNSIYSPLFVTKDKNFKGITERSGMVDAFISFAAYCFFILGPL